MLNPGEECDTFVTKPAPTQDDRVGREWAEGRVENPGWNPVLIAPDGASP